MTLRLTSRIVAVFVLFAAALLAIAGVAVGGEALGLVAAIVGTLTFAESLTPTDGELTGFLIDCEEDEG